MEQGKNEYHLKLKNLMDQYVHQVYDLSDNFPKKEVFGITSQLRRAALSIILNYIEGYARQRKMVLKNFLEISYGSLKEAGYLIDFSYKRGFFESKEYKNLLDLSDKIGAMLWGTMRNL